MTEASFPEAMVDEFARGSKDWKDYDAEDVDAWLKRCIDDYPDEKDEKYIIGRAYPNSMGSTTTFNSVYFLTDLETWFKKWFSQFKE